MRRCRGLLTIAMSLSLVLLLSGCSVDGLVHTFGLDHLVTFFTAGPVAAYERNLMLFVFTVMLFVLVPVVGFTLWFAWHYRAANRQNTYSPNWHHSSFLEVFLWGGPVVIILILGSVTWVTTHDLDPYKPLESDNPTIEVQAIAMDWKWLFIYPEYDVAVVNEIAMPVDVPVRFHLTSASVMNAFMIPRLGSQIFAMSGMETKLHLMADQKGTFFGKNYQYSGDGFAHMNFEAHSVSQEDFDAWIAKAKASGNTLDEAAYEKLVKPSEDDSVSYYSSVRPDLFQSVMAKFNGHDSHGGHDGNAHKMSHHGSDSH